MPTTLRNCPLTLRSSLQAKAFKYATKAVEGLGDPTNWDKTWLMSDDFADGGLVEYNLAVCYTEGVGTDQDIKRATALFETGTITRHTSPDRP